MIFNNLCNIGGVVFMTRTAFSFIFTVSMVMTKNNDIVKLKEEQGS